jgi:hypothetical protein
MVSHSTVARPTLATRSIRYSQIANAAISTRAFESSVTECVVGRFGSGGVHWLRRKLSARDGRVAGPSRICRRSQLGLRGFRHAHSIFIRRCSWPWSRGCSACAQRARCRLVCRSRNRIAGSGRRIAASGLCFSAARVLCTAGVRAGILPSPGVLSAADSHWLSGS